MGSNLITLYKELSILSDFDLYLASQSPRRRELLSNAGIKYRIYNRKNYIETPEVESPDKFVVKLAQLKSVEAVNSITNGIILTADTIVYIDGEILEKPVDGEDAKYMISRLQGKTHQVYTGICLNVCPDGVSNRAYEVTDVTFAPMKEPEIDWYIDSGEFHDKAGAYAIQGKASLFIEGIKGCYFNVVGFPLNRFYKLLTDLEILLKRKRG